MRKKKKGISSWQRGQSILFLSGNDQYPDNIVAVVSGHHAYVFGRSDD